MTLSYNTDSMDSGRRYTLPRLADASAAALDALGVEARNGQVRDRPDIRTIRYYGSLGLVDRPAEMSGRTALYSDRHLLQVLAVKALQARGASLADVQRSLVGASDTELRGAVGPGLPAALTAAAEARPAEVPVTAAAAATAAAARLSATDGRRRDGAFWRARPAPPVPAQPGAMQPRPVTAIALAPGVTLLIDSDNARAVDAAALRSAADPLLTYLTGAGLMPVPHDPPRS
jgi:DNA-binding transcriptional MerR regulator